MTESDRPVVDLVTLQTEQHRRDLLDVDLRPTVATRRLHVSGGRARAALEA